MDIDLYVVNRSGVRQAALPDAQLKSMSWVLNDSGTMTFTINPLAQGASSIDGVRREIQVWVDNVLMWWGVPWAFTGGPTEVTVTCEGLLSLFTKRFVDRTTLTYASVDQLSIGWDLLNYAQSESVEANRNLSIVSDSFSASGVTRSRIYARDEHKMLLDCLKEFDGRVLLNGFDWEIRIVGDGGRFWKPYYPKKGANKGNYAMQWEAGRPKARNLSGFSWAKDFGSLATLAYVTGGTVTTGSTNIKKEGKYEDTGASGSPYWGQMQTVLNDGSQLDQTWLDNRAQREVTNREVPVIGADVKSVRTVDLDVLTGVVVGDWLPIKIDHGMIQVDDWRRVYEMVYDAPSNSVDFVFGEVVASP